MRLWPEVRCWYFLAHRREALCLNRDLRNKQHHDGRFGDVAGGVGGEDFNDVFAEFAIEDAVLASAKRMSSRTPLR